jgi:hypothetical protein
MAYQRPTQRDLAAARKLERQQDMDRAIAEGRLTVRAMTADERAQSDARWAAAAPARAGRRKRSQYR